MSEHTGISEEELARMERNLERIEGASSSAISIWRGWYRSDVAALVAEVRRLRASGQDSLAFAEIEHERDLLREVALRIWDEVEPTQYRDLMVDLGFVLSMTGDRELSALGDT